jgi:hypothetical protein
MAAKRKLVVIDGDTGQVTPVGFKAKNRVSLPMTPKKALREAASTYAAVRRGEIPAEVGTKLSYMLKTCGDLHDIAEVQPRIEALEQRLIAISEMLARQQR